MLRRRFAIPLVLTVQLLSGFAIAQSAPKFDPITIQAQGSFAVGGTVAQTPGTYDNNAPSAVGQSLHGDHLYAFYQIPQNPNVKAIVAFEPGSGFIFPEGEVPPPMPSAAGTLTAEPIAVADFEKLARIPIVLYYGDNFSTEPTKERGEDNWRVRLAMARLWVDAVNKHGGDARLVHLPDIGIRGNTHFLMSDLNNVQIADEVSKFLAEKKLD